MNLAHIAIVSLLLITFVSGFISMYFHFTNKKDARDDFYFIARVSSLIAMFVAIGTALHKGILM